MKTLIFIDSEFNDYKGELISMALIDINGNEFYESLGCSNPSPWVAENVMPVIGKKTIDKENFQDLLSDYLNQYNEIHIVADWPEDIKHFCDALITGPGQRIDTPELTMEIRRDLDCTSRIPHNALEDVRSIRNLYLSKVIDNEN